METNPYAPPKATVSDVDAPGAAAPSFPVPGGLYTSGQHFVAAFLGSPFAAALVAAANYRKLRRPRDARNIVLWGIGGTFVLFGIAAVLPSGFPSAVLPLVYSAGVRALAESRFGELVTAHRAAGGKSASWWRLVGWSLVGLLSLVAFGAFIYGLGVALTHLGEVE